MTTVITPATASCSPPCSLSTPWQSPPHGRPDPLKGSQAAPLPQGVPPHKEQTETPPKSLAIPLTLSTTPAAGSLPVSRHVRCLVCAGSRLPACLPGPRPSPRGDLLHTPAQVRGLPGTHTYHTESPTAGRLRHRDEPRAHTRVRPALEERNISILPGTETSYHLPYELPSGPARASVVGNGRGGPCGC